MSISAIKCLPSALLIYSVCISQNIFAKDYYDPSLLRIGDDSHGVMSNEDLSIFESLDTPPGHYQIELYINKNKVEYRNVYLYSRVDQAQNKHLLPCLSLQDLKNYGIRLPKVQLIQLANSNQCVDLSEHDFIRSDLDMNSNTLSLKIPQSYIDTEKLLQFEQQYWDQGIPAVLVDYSFSQFNSRRNHQSYNSYFANIRGGINYGAWRLNNYSTWIRNESGQSQWNNINTTLSRNIQSIKGELSLGNVYTASTLFDGIKINGVKLQSDRQMQPISSASYAPGINGIADAESIITIKQNDQVIYKKAVAAGPFYITDYYPMSSGGNLFVDIESMDGIKKQLIVPFSSMSILERKGNFNYHFASGQYQSNDQNDGEYIHQADLFYGATDYVTLSTGLQASIKYKAFSLGTGLNLGSMGATSLNVIHSESTTREQKFRGNAFKLNYNKVFTPTNTNVTLVGYKHFDDTYMSFTEAMAYDELNNKDRKLKNEFTAALTQTLPNQWGSLNLSSTIYQYSQNRNTRSLNLGYSLSRNQFNYGVYYRYFDGESVNDLRSSGKYDLSFNISFPLSFKSRPIYSSYNLSRSSEGGSNQNIRLSGLAGERSQASWDIYQGYDSNGVDYYAGLNGSYQSQFANLNAGYAYSDQNSSLNYAVSGAVVASKYGVVLSQPLQGTHALVLTEDSPGIEVINNASAKTNKSGLTVVSGLSPYRKNNLALNTQTIPDDAEIEESILNNIIPTKGALVLADFKSNKGYKLLINLKTPHIQIPMGAIANMENGTTAIVSNFNQLYIISKTHRGLINVQWRSNRQDQSCDVNFDATQIKAINGLYIMDAECRSPVAISAGL